MIKTTDFNALTIQMNEWYNEAAVEAVAEWTGKTLFDCGETDWEVYKYQTLHGMAKFDRLAQGAQFPVASSVQGDSANYTQHRFGGRVSITKDMRMFDRYDLIEELVRTNTEYAFDKIDQSHADFLLNGFSGTSYTDIFGYVQSNVAPDGVVFFSASHSNNLNANVFSNRITDTAGTTNPELSRDAIVKTRANAKRHKDPNEVTRPTNLNKLIVPAALEDLAERTVYSSGVQGTPNVDLNPLKSKVSNIVVWPRLDVSSQGTDTDAYWFLASEKTMRSLKSPFAQRVLMAAPEQVHDSYNWEWVTDAYYTMGAGHPAHVYGSTGANS